VKETPKIFTKISFIEVRYEKFDPNDEIFLRHAVDTFYETC